MRALLLLAALGQDKPQVWAVDPLVKVFRDDAPAADSAPARADAARGEWVSLQVVLRSAQPLRGLSARVAPFEPKLGEVRCRFVGYVPVRLNVGIGKNRLRPAPADFPDPLLEVESIDVEAGAAQPVWITVFIPADAEPGLYRSRVEFSTGDSHPLEVRVFPVTVPAERSLWVTNWFWDWSLVKFAVKDKKKFSEEYWETLRAVARNMAEHRQNVVLTTVNDLVRFSMKEGRLQFDWSNLDRWIRLFIDEGVIGRIEGGHIGGRAGKWTEPFSVWIWTPGGARNVDPESPEAADFYGQYLPALREHLKERGWLDRYVQHIADEPVPQNARSWLAAAALVRKHMPGVKIIDALHTAKELLGSVDIWVPMLNTYQSRFHPARQEAGEEVWIYTCVHPQGYYPNRFIQQPLVLTRLLHWVNYKLGATGYLHWGFSHWSSDDPFTKTEPKLGDFGLLPAGDSWIVYPRPGGILDSIRWEAMRDGIEDYELLRLLKKSEADSIVNDEELGLKVSRCTTGVAAFRSAHRRLLQLLSGEY
jgi:hypothetical protein